PTPGLDTVSLHDALPILARHRARLPDDAWRTRVVEPVTGLAGALVARAQASPWRLAMQSEDFVWGSSAQALNQGFVMVQGYRLTGDRALLDAAQSQLDYVLGRTPLGVSFVTGH